MFLPRRNPQRHCFRCQQSHVEHPASGRYFNASNSIPNPTRIHLLRLVRHFTECLLDRRDHLMDDYQNDALRAEKGFFDPRPAAIHLGPSAHRRSQVHENERHHLFVFLDTTFLHFLVSIRAFTGKRTLGSNKKHLTLTDNTIFTMMKLCLVLFVVSMATTTTAFLTGPSSFSRHHAPTTSILPLLPSSHQTFKHQTPQQNHQRQPQLTSTATPTAGEGGAMEAVPKKGFWGKVSSAYIQDGFQNNDSHISIRLQPTAPTGILVIRLQRSNLPCPHQKNVKSYFLSALCSFASYSTTRSFGIPRMYSWSPRQSQAPKLFHSSKHTSTYQQPLHLPDCMPA